MLHVRIDKRNSVRIDNSRYIGSKVWDGTSRFRNSAFELFIREWTRETGELLQPRVVSTQMQRVSIVISSPPCKGYGSRVHLMVDNRRCYSSCLKNYDGTKHRVICSIYQISNLNAPWKLLDNQKLWRIQVYLFFFITDARLQCYEHE